jgi:hypothetical protein
LPDAKCRKGAALVRRPCRTPGQSGTRERHRSRKRSPFPWVDDLEARGNRLTGDQLAPPRRARSVRVRAGKKLITDGPFAETKETVGGFDLLECESLEEAIEIAAAHPVAGAGTIEVRPLWGN